MARDPELNRLQDEMDKAYQENGSTGLNASTSEDLLAFHAGLLHPANLAVGKAPEVEAGDPDHPGGLKDAAKLPLARLPLRDPLTLKPIP